MTLIDLRPGEARTVTRTDWLESRHSFSFGAHYDPANTGFGLLVVVQRGHRRAGRGFAPHPHRDLEVVTWVLEGELLHEDEQGNRGVSPRPAWCSG